MNIRPFFRLSRRGVLAGLLALPAISLGAPARVSDPQALFSKRLAKIRLGFPARLSLVRFEAEGPRLSAVVRMDWTPGYRQRRVRAEATDIETAVDRLEAETARVFSAAGAV